MKEHIKHVPTFGLTSLLQALDFLPTTAFSNDCVGNIGIVTEIDPSGNPISIRCKKCLKDRTGHTLCIRGYPPLSANNSITSKDDRYNESNKQC